MADEADLPIAWRHVVLVVHCQVVLVGMDGEREVKYPSTLSVSAGRISAPRRHVDDRSVPLVQRQHRRGWSTRDERAADDRAGGCPPDRRDFVRLSGPNDGLIGRSRPVAEAENNGRQTSGHRDAGECHDPAPALTLPLSGDDSLVIDETKSRIFPMGGGGRRHHDALCLSPRLMSMLRSQPLWALIPTRGDAPTPFLRRRLARMSSRAVCHGFGRACTRRHPGADPRPCFNDARAESCTQRSTTWPCRWLDPGGSCGLKSRSKGIGGLWPLPLPRSIPTARWSGCESRLLGGTCR